MDMYHGDRPGLLLLWHGDFPDGFLDSEKNMVLFQQCLLARDILQSQSFYDKPRFDDDYALAGLHIAYHLLSRMKPDHLELSYLSLRSPGIRQAVYRTAARGARRIICAGASGLMLPGYGADKILPLELNKVFRDNPALDLLATEPAIDSVDIVRIVQQSLAYTFHGQAGKWKMPGRSFRSMEERGIVLVCAHDPASVSGSIAALNNFARASSEISKLSREACMGGCCPAIGGLLRQAEAQLRAGGFHAVESGFIDFALPDVSEAARRLVDAGCTHIIVTGATALLHRHPYSCGGPAESVERLKNELPDANIVYVKPDPGPIAPYLADVVMSSVLDSDENGRSLISTLRAR
ncbi:MAG TPA: hypothetical protein VMC84_01600 [Methanocella sp.]|uniref:hypothetical protein n=1 Tax=Methanocella sp. TaxID=2052833 RepID=UPI002C8E1412|nr:hypothetical protein [Methanocella sp.]HTY89848.1 hypothetical protein [Methanocella sp.]